MPPARACRRQGQWICCCCCDHHVVSCELLSLLLCIMRIVKLVIQWLLYCACGRRQSLMCLAAHPASREAARVCRLALRATLLCICACCSLHFEALVARQTRTRNLSSCRLLLMLLLLPQVRQLLLLIVIVDRELSRARTLTLTFGSGRMGNAQSKARRVGGNSNAADYLAPLQPVARG